MGKNKTIIYFIVNTYVSYFHKDRVDYSHRDHLVSK